MYIPWCSVTDNICCVDVHTALVQAPGLPPVRFGVLWLTDSIRNSML
jgi:hypothetical protein